MNKKEAYHFVGIGGIGMSALAHILLEKQHAVSGSDLSLSTTSQLLQEKGAHVLGSHSADNIVPKISVVYGSAISETNPEIIAAKEQGCPIIHRSELLAELVSSSQAIAVTGTHGKTSTSALLASVFLHAKKDISFAVGGYLKEYGVNGHFGKDKLFVLEADESDNSFLLYTPSAAIITNVEEEHMECFGTREKLHHSFGQFFDQVKDERLLFYCGDDEVLGQLAKGRGSSYGFSEGCDYHVINFRQEGWHIFFDLVVGSRRYLNVEVAMTGKHNALNAAAVFALSLKLGLSDSLIREGLKNFKGVKRRCETTFENESVLLIDDYGHHPTEIVTTLKAIKAAVGPRRVIAIFQPHRYTRTKAHLDTFARAFEFADLLFVTDIYAASEKPIEGVTATNFLLKVKELSTVEAFYLPLEEGVQRVAEEVRSLDVVVTIGAGSITNFNQKLVAYFSKESVSKLHVGLVFGGSSVEHAISRKSAAFVAASLHKKLYNLSYFAIDKQGRWQIGERAKEMLESAEEISFEGEDQLFSVAMKGEIDKIDLFFPVLHGPNGEDGTLQGFFEILQKPYVGPDHRTAAIGMDKVITKRVLMSASIPTPPFVSFDRAAFKEKGAHFLKEIKEKLCYPLYVKPSHLGSSVGVEKVTSERELIEAIKRSLVYDTHLLIEEAIEGGRELEFAVVGNGSLAQVAHPGEKLAEGVFVDYEMKYGKNPVKTSVVAELDEALLKKGKELALRAYTTLQGSGMMRIDFILDQAGTFWCFEVNPIPGMQKFSLFPKVWEQNGISNGKLFDWLIALALERKREGIGCV